MIEKLTEESKTCLIYTIFASHRTCALHEYFKIIWRGWEGNMDTQTFPTGTGIKYLSK